MTFPSRHFTNKIHYIAKVYSDDTQATGNREQYDQSTNDYNLPKTINKVEHIRSLSGSYVRTRILSETWSATGRRETFFYRPDKPVKEFEMRWTDLSCIVDNNWIPLVDEWLDNRFRSFRTILRSLNGSIKSSQLIAIMGPSGSGKSTLLDCVFGRRSKGLSGEVTIRGDSDIKVVTITQNDFLTDKFTLREALLFASKTKNRFSDVIHQSVVFSIVNHMSLSTILDTPLEKCSSGERIRISIALELVSILNIIILDEPTSGLDSSSCLQLVKILRDLCKRRRIAIVATIHQPSATVFNIFDNIYMLSHRGHNIYNGPPAGLVAFLAKVNLHVPEYYNPADFVLEVASGEHGEECVEELALMCDQLSVGASISVDGIASQLKTKLSQSVKWFSVADLFRLIQRGVIITRREPQLSTVRIASSAMLGLLVALMVGTEPAQYDGCQLTGHSLYRHKSAKNFEEERAAIKDNLASLFMITQSCMFSGIMPVIMTFAKEFNTMKKEHRNGWYSSLAYYLSKVIIEVPMCFIAPSIYITIWYWMTRQVQEWWRFTMLILSGFLLTLNTMSHGMIFSALFAKNPISAAYISLLSIMPFGAFSGFLIKSNRLTGVLALVNNMSYVKYSYEAIVIAIYGYERCVSRSTPTANSSVTIDPTKHEILGLITGQVIDDLTLGNGHNPSMVMSQFGFADDMLFYNIYAMLAFTLSLQMLAFLVFAWKLRSD